MFYAGPLFFLLSFLLPLSANLEEGDEAKIQKFNAIVKDYENEIKKDPQNLRLILAVGDVYYSLQEYNKAIDYYGRALKIDPQNNKIKTKLAFSLLNDNDLRQSHALFEQVIQVDPTYIEALGGFRTHRSADASSSTG